MKVPSSKPGHAKKNLENLVKIIRGYQGGGSKILQGLKSLRGQNLPRPRPESFSKSLNMAISNSQRFFEITP